MQMHVAGQDIDGMGASPLELSGEVGFVSPVNIDRVQITTCARQRVCQQGGYCDKGFLVERGWLGGVQNAFKFSYKPTPAEMEAGCGMYAEAYSLENLTSWGFLAFQTSEQLKAHMDCNGEHLETLGMTACQTRAGLEQALSFDQPVAWTADAICHMTTSDQQHFRLSPEEGFCRATFKVDQPTGAVSIHRLVLLAYSAVLVRVK